MSSVRLTEDIREKVRQVAEMKGVNVSEVHRQALEEYCNRELSQIRKSRYDDIIGVGEGSADLSARTREVFGEIMSRKHG